MLNDADSEEKRIKAYSSNPGKLKTHSKSRKIKDTLKLDLGKDLILI
jgi:hypothetical protein